MKYPKNINQIVESKYEPANFNVFYYWRRWKPRVVKHKYTPLEDRIKNGDYEISDYRQQAFYELWLLDDRLEKERPKFPSREAWLNRKEVIESQQYDRYRRLMTAFDKEEPKMWGELVRELANNLRHLGPDRSSRVDLINKLVEDFDGTTLDLYYYLKKYNNGQ
jgi:hypothetical protein